jgi:hypothetical protein
VIVGNKLTAVFTGAATQQLAGPNPRRVGLIACPPSSSTFFLAIGDISAANDGIRFNSGNYSPLVLLFDAPNDWITSPINVTALAACTCNFVELVDRQP